MHLRRWSVPALALILLSSIAVSAQRPARRAKIPVTEPAIQTVAMYKGIFEPVNYGQDINFTDVFFISPNVGWVSGEHATILKTTDGGTTWKVQVGGDPNGTEKPIGQLRFLDARHGWAVTDDQRLLRTMDGENWEQIGQQPAPGSGFVDYAFTSLRHGIALGGNMGGFYVTNDAGRHWVNVTSCKVHATVQGLPRTEDCRVKKLQMLSIRSGYASAEWSGGIVFLRTDDGGEHWTSIVNDVSTGWPDFFFTDLNHGVMVSNNGKTYVTDDGARSWHALLSSSIGIGWGQGHMGIQFADPEVGWVIGASPDNYRSFRVSFSTDGGRHWRISQNDINFPVDADRLRFNVARRDRAYVIGDHGMIYRYRVVPKTYTVANSFDAPAMPEASDAILQARTQRVRNDIAALQAKLSAAIAAGGGPANSASTPGASSVAGAVSSTTDAVPSASDASAPSAGSMDASAGSVASVDGGAAGAAPSTSEVNSGATASLPDANSGAAASQPDAASTAPDSNVASSPADAGASPNSDSATSAAGDTTFVPSIDNSAPSAPVAACCAAQVQALQNDVGGLTQQLPTFAGKFRSLNMIVAGLQIFSDLLNKAQTMRDTFRTLKHAPSLQAASAALMQLASSVQSTQQNITAELQNPGSVTLPASDASAPAPAAQGFAQPADAGVVQPDAIAQPDAASQSSTATPVPQSATPAASTTSSPDSSGNPGGDSVSQQIDNAAQKAKQKLKSKLKWPH
jgi:photosystem II stability/assembly factor-like uncharacterized protein